MISKCSSDELRQPYTVRCPTCSGISTPKYNVPLTFQLAAYSDVLHEQSSIQVRSEDHLRKLHRTFVLRCNLYLATALVSSTTFPLTDRLIGYSEATAPPVCTLSTNVPCANPRTVLPRGASRFSPCTLITYFMQFAISLNKFCLSFKSLYSSLSLHTQRSTRRAFDTQQIYCHPHLPSLRTVHLPYTLLISLTRPTISFHCVHDLHDPPRAYAQCIDQSGV